MRLTFARVLAAAWELFRRERALVTALAGPFIFLPGYALLLLCDPIPTLPAPPRDDVATERWLAQVTQWAGTNGGWYLLADAVELFGLAAIVLLLVGQGRPTVAEAMRGAARRWPAFAVVAVLAALPFTVGLWLLVLPGLYAQARLIAALPALAAEPQAGPLAALRRSLRLTRREWWALTGATVALFLTQWLAVLPLLTADTWLRETAHANPVLLALVDAALALVAAAWRVAVLLVGVAIYRAEARSGT